jgi:serine/threonine protein kinase
MHKEENFYFSRKVIKEFDLRKVPPQYQAEDIFREALEMSKFKHENITKYYEHFKNQKETFFYIVYEYCEVSLIIKSNFCLIYK